MLPEPNPERGKILERATVPKRRIPDGGFSQDNHVATQDVPKLTIEQGVASNERQQPIAPQNQDGDAKAIKPDSNPIPDDNTVANADALSQLESEYNKLMQEAAPLMEQAYDQAAEELRPLTIAKRLRYLETMRKDLEADVDEDADPVEEAELNDHIINNFIVAMNERGVYFE